MFTINRAWALVFGHMYLHKNKKKVLFSLPWGVLNKFLYGEAPPRGLTPYLVIHNFLVEKVLLSYNFYWQMVVLFHIPSFELCIHLNSCKCTVFKIWRNHKTRTFFRLLLSHKMHLSALLGFYTAWNDMFSYPFYLYQLVKSPPFHIPEAWERCPFRTEPPSVILLPLHTASPMHKNPKRCKIIHGMRPMGAKIDQ